MSQSVSGALRPSRAVALLLSALLVGALGVAENPFTVSPAQATVPGRPGTPQAPTPLFTDDFSGQSAAAGAIDIITYQGAPGTEYVPGTSGASSLRYTADPTWQGNANRCNGWVVNGGSTPTPPGWNPGCDFTAVKNLVSAIGRYQGQTATASLSNQATTAYTASGTVAPGVMAATVGTVTAVAGHFYLASAVLGATNCTGGPSDPQLTFTLLVNGTPNVVGSGQNPCTASNRQQFGNGPFGPTYVAQLRSTALKVPETGDPQLGLRLTNASPAVAGNDGAFDLPQILDVTPQLDKVFSPGAIAAGGVSTLTYTVTNTLDLAAKNGWAFTDVLPGGVTATGVDSTNCSGATVTAAAGSGTVSVAGGVLNAGQSSCSITVQVTATAPGTYVNGPDNFPPGTAGLSGLNPPAETQLVVQPPASLVVTKQSTTTAILSVGQRVSYRFLVENRGDIPLTNLQVQDAQEPPASQAALSAISCPVTTLAPHASTTCVATYTVSQADLDNGSVADTATATATDPQNGTVTAPPSRLSLSGPQGAIAVVKESATTLVSAVGQVVPYRYRVTNTGNVQLLAVAVTDTVQPPSDPAGLTPVACPQPSLAPGASEVCTASYTATAADLVNGRISDSAVATAADPDGTPIGSAPSTLAIPASAPGSLSIVKASTTTTLTAAGQTIPYTFRVTNNSTGTISNLQIADTQEAPALPANMSAISCPLTSLAPGQSTTCTGTYTVTLADLNSGQVTDTAVARGTDSANNPVASSPSSVTITVPVAGLSVQKATATATVSAVGQQIPFTFTVTNTGNVTVSGVGVTDTPVAPSSTADMSAVVCPQTTLAPGVSEICTGTYTVTAADLANGSVNDSAVATGRDPSNAAVASPQSSASIPVRTAALTIVKATTADSIVQLGQVVPLQFTVSNNSDVVYSDVSITDQPLSPAGPPVTVTCPEPVLQPHQSVTCTSEHVVTAEDLANGSISDAARASGRDPGGATFTTSESSVVVPLDARPALSVRKQATTPRLLSVGQQAQYTFTVTNTGNTLLTAIAVQDTVEPPASPGNLSAIDCPQTRLLPGESVVCTGSYTVTQADLDRGFVTDAATATGTAPGGATVTARPSSATITTNPALEVTKATTATSFDFVGQSIPLTFEVRNVGGDVAENIAVTDTQDAPSPQSAMSGIVCPQTTLAAGASTTCTGTYTVTQQDLDHGSLSDSAVATGTDSAGTPLPPSDRSALSLPAVQSSALTVVKSSTTAAITGTGQSVRFEYLVTNTGNTTLDALVVTDTVAAPASPANLSPVTCLRPSLAPGESQVCTASYVTAQEDLDHGSVTDSAVASGTDPTGATISSPPSGLTIPAPVPLPALTIVKSAGVASIAGLFQQVVYSFLVTNTGGRTVTGLQVQDVQAPPATQANLSAVDCPATTLAPGTSTTCTATYTVTQPDLDHGSLTDEATASGTGPGGEDVTSQPSSTTVPVLARSGLEVTKETTTHGLTAVGQVVPFTIRVRNTGNQTVTGVTVQDVVAAPSLQSNLSAVSCPATVLAPDGSMTCTAEYTATAADLTHGRIADSASATAILPSGGSVTSDLSDAAVPVVPSAGLLLAKSTPSGPITAAGETVAYFFDVTNTGNQAVTGLSVADTLAAPSDPAGLSAVRCPVTSLAPGASTTCTATYTVTQADVDNGRMADTATATATRPDGAEVASAPDDLVVPIVAGGAGPPGVLPPAPSAPQASQGGGTDLPDTGSRVRDGTIALGLALLVAGSAVVALRHLRRRPRRG